MRFKYKTIFVIIIISSLTLEYFHAEKYHPVMFRYVFIVTIFIRTVRIIHFQLIKLLKPHCVLLCFITMRLQI